MPRTNICIPACLGPDGTIRQAAGGHRVVVDLADFEVLPDARQAPEGARGSASWSSPWLVLREGKVWRAKAGRSPFPSAQQARRQEELDNELSRIAAASLRARGEAARA